jgi:hypothetical protein
MPRKRRPLQAQIDDLRKMIRAQGKAIEELQEVRSYELTSAIGFEVDQVEDDEEEQPEYRGK